MSLPLAFLHGEQVLFGIVVAGLISLIGVPLLLYVWLWRTKWSELKLAISYFILVAVLCVVFGAIPNDPSSILSIIVFAFTFVLTLPWSVLAVWAVSEFNSGGSDIKFAIWMSVAAGVNAVLLYFVAVKMRRLIKA